MPERESLAPPGADFPAIIGEAWRDYGDSRPIVSVREMSANVSTNRVFLVRVEGGYEVVAKTSSYGSYVHFRQDHRIIQQWIRKLGGTRYRNFLAGMLVKNHEVYTYRDGNEWVVFYEKAPFYDFLPKVLSGTDIDCLAREMAEFHHASASVAPDLLTSWKTLGSDVAALFDTLGSAEWRRERGLPDSAESVLRRHCDLFFTNAERLGYHQMQKMPVLVDWNIGNFSVGYDGDGFRFYRRWDYDWFRVEPRMLDFYFCSRVVRSEGDQTVFSYTVAPLFEERFVRFLRTYDTVYQLEDEEILFLGEAYRVFLLNYVVRSGEYFFRDTYYERLHHEAVQRYLPELEEADFGQLLRAVRAS